jgi:hypothetical protein
MNTLHNLQNLSGFDSGTIILYQTEDGQTKLDVKLQDETVWLSLTQMAVLFERDKSVISRHLTNIFREGELDREAVIAKMQQLPLTAKLIRLTISIWMP